MTTQSSRASVQPAQLVARAAAFALAGCLVASASAGESSYGVLSKVTGHGPSASTGVLPAYVPQIIDPAFDVAFADARTNSSIQFDLARVMVDPGFIMTVGDPESGPSMIHACFARNPDGSLPAPEVITTVNQYLLDTFSGRYQFFSGEPSWASGPGTPVNLTWSFVPNTVNIPSGVGEAAANSALFEPGTNTMDDKFGGNRALWISQFQSVFNRWQALTGVNYTRVTAAGVDWDDGAAWGTSGNGTTRGDIRISMKNIDGGSGILAYNSSPTNGDMVMDQSESWGTSASSYIFLRNVVAHEHGHGLGMAHVCPITAAPAQGKLMEPFYEDRFDGPQQDDVRGVQRRYGDIYEPNGTATSAFNLGTLAPSSVTNIGTGSGVPNGSTAGLAGNETDIYKFTVDAPRLVNISVTPIGTTYLNGPQNANGSCSAGTNIAALSQHDLVIALLPYSNATTLGTAYISVDAADVGVGETQVSVLINAGDNAFRVTSGNSVANNETQLYTAQIQIQGSSPACTASDGSFTDKVLLTWPTIANVTRYRVIRNTTNTPIGGITVGTLNAPANTVDDTSAVPGTTYFYYLQVEQFGNGIFRNAQATGTADTGRRNAIPTANAGSDQTVTDTDNSGSESVTLSGSGTDSDGTISTYTWRRLGNVILTGQSGSVSLPVGTHVIELTVTDNNGATQVDTVTITVNAPVPAGCDSIDFNGNGVFPEDQDVVDFFEVLAGGACPTGSCNDVDFNNNGVFPEDQDVIDFFNVLAGGSCP
ncbi:MAG TPA: matrixin family metalloprotease [Phycisphaerales bacterium]|nr:matrixin family metalloprotease [Phycisphaerales bacterium]